MKELLEGVAGGALKALERLGAEWEARRATKVIAFDAIECVTLIQTDEGVIKGLVEVVCIEGVSRRANMAVTCYLGGHLKKDGTFKSGKHPKSQTTKIFEYESEVPYRYSKIFGVGLGFRPAGAVPAEHQFLADFTERLIADVDAAQKAANDEAMSAAEERRRKNEETARRALFG